MLTIFDVPFALNFIIVCVGLGRRPSLAAAQLNQAQRDKFSRVARETCSATGETETTLCRSRTPGQFLEKEPDGSPGELRGDHGGLLKDHVSRSGVRRLYFACEILTLAAAGNCARIWPPLVTTPASTSIFVV